MPRFSRPALLLCAALSTGLAAPPAMRAELPPWVYGAQQREAPLVVTLEVVRTVQVAGLLEARCRVLRVVRQAPTGQIRAGQLLQLRYPLPPERSSGFVGPSALRLVREGERLTAWLSPVPGTFETFEPAAGGRSFGPSLEKVREPGTGGQR